jgi:hypothetical protein
MAGLWQPYWRANTAYSLTAVVIPTATVFAGWTWRCTVAGTSGGTEPVWPDPTITPTIVDGGVTWSVGTGARQAFQYGLKSVVQAFSAANPTIVRAVKTVRPRSFETGELPLLYIGDMSESIDTSQGVRTRSFAGFSAFYVDHLGADVDYSNDRMNFAADVLADLFTANYHAGGGYSLFTHVGTTDTEFEVPVPAVGLEFLFAATKIQEGRT